MTMPTLPGVNTTDPNAMNAWANVAQQVYNQTLAQTGNDRLAFDQANAAMQQANALAGTYGWAPGGNWTSLSSLAANAPPMGTPTQSLGQQIGAVGYVPNVTGFNANQTLTGQQQYFNQAGSTAGLTGVFTAPAQSQYTPGSWLTISNDTLPAGQGQQIGYVQPNGQIQRMDPGQAMQQGYKPGQTQLTSIPYEQFMALSNAPPTGLPQQTLAALQAYAALNNAQQAANTQTAQQTGLYTNQAPMYLAQQGYALNGSNFYQQPESTLQAYMNVHHDPTAAMNAWVQDVNNSINTWRQQQGQPPLDYTTNYAGGQYGGQTPTLSLQAMYGTYGVPTAGQQTLAAQKQYADLYGGTGAAPTAGQTTLFEQQQAYNQWLATTQEARAQWQGQQTAAQNYLNLLSQQRGPADYAQYMRTLASTPGGMQDLVRAAAGQYIPGSGTTGVQPQGANLNTLYQQATGQGMAQSQQDLQNAQNTLVAPNQMSPQTYNALTPTQRDMLTSIWESQGYTADDVKNLYQQSLPKYATTSPGVGQFRLV